MASDGTQGNGESPGLLGNDDIRTSISGNGRFIALSSEASNLVPNDTNDTEDIFIIDLENGSVERLSLNAAGSESPNGSSDPVISRDGRFVAFSGGASLSPECSLGFAIYLRDRQNGMIECVSLGSDGSQATGAPIVFDMDGEGLFVVFSATGENIVANDTNGLSDIFVRDRQTETTSRVSIASDGVEANGGSFLPRISADGRFVAFVSDADNLVDDDTNQERDAFVHDRVTGNIERISISSDGVEAVLGARQVSGFSDDGRFVAFSSEANNLVDGDVNEATDVFIRDRELGATRRISFAEEFAAFCGGGSNSPEISSDGRYVAFRSCATDLVPNDTNDASDVFVVERVPVLPFQSAAKFICGTQSDPADTGLAQGFYATKVNVHNPNAGHVYFKKRLALAFPPDEQAPGEVIEIAEHVLPGEHAIQIDCANIAAEAFDSALPAPYIEGFMVLESTHSLDVSSVYTTAAVSDSGDLTGHSSIDVEQIIERKPIQGADLRIAKRDTIHNPDSGLAVPYVIEVTNEGPASALDVVVQDTVTVEVGELTSILDDFFAGSHGAQWTVASVTETTAQLFATIPVLPASQTATLEFAARVVVDFDQEPASARVINTASVSSSLPDPNPANDNVTIETQWALP